MPEPIKAVSAGEKHTLCVSSESGVDAIGTQGLDQFYCVREIFDLVLAAVPLTSQPRATFGLLDPMRAVSWA